MKRERESDEPCESSKNVKFMCPSLELGGNTTSSNGVHNSSSVVLSLAFTWSGCLLVALDSHCYLHVFKLHHSIDPSK